MPNFKIDTTNVIPNETHVEANGLTGVLAGATTLFKPAEAVSGIPKYTAIAIGAVAGNVIATHSQTGQLGVSALGKTVSFG